MTFDPTRRRAEFRDIASAILRDDRTARKSGRSVDTGGSVARALERAYRAGVADALAPIGRRDAEAAQFAADAGHGLAWIEIPSRLRDGFSRLMVHGAEFLWKRPDGEICLVLTLDKQPIARLSRWRVAKPRSAAHIAYGEDWRWGTTIIAGLAARDLIRFPGSSGVAHTTGLAHATWLTYLRSDAPPAYVKASLLQWEASHRRLTAATGEPLPAFG